MATILFQVTEDCKNRENGITHCFFHGFAYPGVKWQLLGDKYATMHICEDT